MSAYVVDRDHITYMVEAALSPRISHNCFTWFHDGKHHELRPGDLDEMVRIANVLWLENVVSVQYRYDDCNSTTELPGPIGENFIITADDFRAFRVVYNPLQVCMSCHCYIYQTCEHPWHDKSEAMTFIKSLEGSAIRSMPGYEDMTWGAPKRKILQAKG